MCGLVGAIGDLTAQHERVVKTMLIFDVVRGEDSTGVAVVRRFDESVHVAKELGNPFNLFETKRFDKALSGCNKVIIGHNRYATQGGVSRRNAHPFDFDTLVGAHNGTLSSKHKLLNAKDFAVDSENLYHHIEELGVDDAISHLGSPGNAWALTWWDKQESSFHILRNKERTLFHTFTTDNKVMFWASEMWMLAAALNRTDIKYGAIHPIHEDMLYTIKVDKQGNMDKPHVRALAAPKWTPAVVTNNASAGNNSTKTSSTTSNPPFTVVGDGKKPEDQVGKRSAYDPSYLGMKERTFELLSINNDMEHGGEFILLFDEENPYYEVRMYLKPREGDILRQHAQDNGFIRSKISQFCQRGGSGYYKASPWDVVIIPITEKKEGDNATLFPNHRGVFLSKKDWEKQYTTCNWCSSPVFAEDANRFTTEGECVCPACADNPQVAEYVKFI